MLGATLPGTSPVVSISGSTTLGGLLTAVLSAGYAVTGYQWTRNGASISGATATTYTIIAADMGTTLACTVIGVSFGSSLQIANYIRFASPNNYISTGVSTNSSTGFLNVRSRMQFIIGSGSLSSLLVSFYGWYFTNTDVVNHPNSFSVVKMAIEKDGQSSSVPITFSGSRTLTINPGDTDVQSDQLLPASFGIAQFTRGDKYWIRLELAVPSSGLTFPQGALTYTNQGFPGSVGLILGSNSSYAAPVDSYGTMSFSGNQGTNWINFTNPFMPLILGSFVSGDPKTIIGAGDSIVNGSGDTTNGYGILGSFSQALFDADRVSNPIAGANFGSSGATGSAWATTNGSKVRQYLKYAKYMMEEHGTNSFLSAGGSSTTAQSLSQYIWSAFTAVGGLTIVRPKLLPRMLNDSASTNTFLTPLNSCWQSGGGAYAFNAWLDTQASSVTVMQKTSMRAGSTEGTTAFYQWTPSAATYTADGTHPSAAGHVRDAAEFRSAFAALT